MVLTLGTLGWRVVFRDPLVLQYRAQPAALRELLPDPDSPGAVPSAPRLVLQEVRERLGLAPDRLQLLSTLATTAAPAMRRCVPSPLSLACQTLPRQPCRHSARAYIRLWCTLLS